MAGRGMQVIGLVFSFNAGDGREGSPGNEAGTEGGYCGRATRGEVHSGGKPQGGGESNTEEPHGGRATRGGRVIGEKNLMRRVTLGIG